MKREQAIDFSFDGSNSNRYSEFTYPSQEFCAGFYFYVILEFLRSKNIRDLV